MPHRRLLRSRTFIVSALFSTTLWSGSAYAVAPPNDLCSGAEVIPATGPFPYLTAVTADITDATTTGETAPSCQSNFSRGIWYTFTPTQTAVYTFATCAPPTGTTVTDTILQVPRSSDGTCAGTFTDVACSDDSSCGIRSQATATLTAGTTYYIYAAQYSTTVPAAGQTAIQVQVTQTTPPPGDSCTSPLPLSLEMPTAGTFTNMQNDYLVSTSAPNCFDLPAPPTPIGQVPNNAPGRDVVYSFTAPGAGSYSFKAQNVITGSDLVLTVASSCPSGAAPNTLSTCLGAANRTAVTGAGASTEEVMCLPLAAGQTVYAFVDEMAAGTASGNYALEVTPCVRETEPNDTPATANAFTCGMEASIGTANDVDYFALGAPASNSRVFALVDGSAISSLMTNNDPEMRITTTVDTLEFDDDTNTTFWGNRSPNIAGRALTGVNAFLRLNYHSTAQITEPMRLYSVIQPPGTGLGSSSATMEMEPNGTSIAVANSATNLFFSGQISTGGAAGDLDLYKFCAEAGDTIFLSIDGDPTRNLTNLDPQVHLLSNTGATLLMFNESTTSAGSLMPGAGNLTATTPHSPAEAAVARAAYTGTYYAGVNTVTTGQTYSTGDYLYSIALNCLRGDQLTTDLALAASAPMGPIMPLDPLAYTITVTNNGPKTALDAIWQATIPANMTYVGVTGPSDWTCTQNAGVVRCTTSCFTKNTSAEFTLNLQATQCPGTSVNFAASVSTKTPDVSAVNNTAMVMTSITDPCVDSNVCTDDSCVPGSGCVFANNTASCNDGNACTMVDTCNAGACVGGSPTVCNDGNPCTDDSCNPTNGTCVTVNNTAPCGDGDACNGAEVCGGGSCQAGMPVICAALDQCHVAGTCNPATGQCSNPNANDGTSCSDGNACTQSDTCQAGMCTGANPVTCAALDQCHVAGTCNPATGQCSNPNANDGTACNDSSACTLTDTCQAGTCTGANPVVCAALDQCHVAGTCNPTTGQCSHPNANDGTSCNDNNACTQTDACQSGGCIGTNPVVCAASDQCHVAGICNPSTGQCSNPMAPDGTSCNDTDGCTQTDTCQTGACVGANPVVCAALDQCHVAGTCNPATGQCSNPNANDGTTCNDNDGCTQSDTCVAGACTGANPVVCAALDQCHVAGTCNPNTGQCSNPNANDGTTCNDNSACTQTDSCQAGICTGANPVVCAALDQCHVVGTCDPTTGQCSNPNANDGMTCNDNDACTQMDACQAGACVGTNAVTCQPLDACHVAGTCDSGTGQCSNPDAVDGTTCSDGDMCTQTDSCQAGSCTGANPVVCAAQDECHDVGTCIPMLGMCDNPAKPDGTPCTNGFCQAGTCKKETSGSGGNGGNAGTGGAAGNGGTGGAAGNGGNGGNAGTGGAAGNGGSGGIAGAGGAVSNGGNGGTGGKGPTSSSTGEGGAGGSTPNPTEPGSCTCVVPAGTTNASHLGGLMAGLSALLLGLRRRRF